jgi:hypothetical protein
MSDNSVPREKPVVPKTASLEEAARYYSDGYIKLDELGHASASDVKKWIELIQDLAADQFPTAANDIFNVKITVNVVPMSATGEVYGLAWVFIHSLTKNHYLYNLIVGLNYDGSTPDTEEKLNPETGELETHVIRPFHLPPLKMNDTSTATYFSTVKQKYEGDLNNEYYLHIKGQYDDYVLRRELVNVKRILKKEDLSSMDREAAEKKQSSLVAQFREEYKIKEGQVVDMPTILKTLKPGADSISTRSPEAKKAFVVDPQAGESRFHLVSKTFLSESLFKRLHYDIHRPDDILTAVKLDFSQYCTTAGPQVRTYAGLGKGGEDLKINAERPHVFFSSDGRDGRLRLNVVYDETSNDGLYALKMSKKFFLTKNTSVQNTILMEAKNDNKVFIERPPRGNDNFSSRLSMRRPRVDYRPRTQRVVPQRLPSANEMNFPVLPSGVDRPVHAESVWTQPLSEFIKKGDDVTIPQSGPAVSANKTADFVRVYGPDVRSDGNEDRFF